MSEYTDEDGRRQREKRPSECRVPLGGYYAHTPPEEQETAGEWEPLSKHLLETAHEALQLGKRIKLAHTMYAALLFHDIGKYRGEYQEYLRASYLARIEGTQGPPRGSVEHAIHGALALSRAVEDLRRMEVADLRAAYQVLRGALAGHHAGLADRWRLDERTKEHEVELVKLREQYDTSEESRREYDWFCEMLRSFREEVGPLGNVVDGRRIVSEIEALVPGGGSHGGLARSETATEMLERMVLSVIADADSLVTERNTKPARSAARERRLSRAPELSRIRDALLSSQKRLRADPGSGTHPHASTVNQVRHEVYQSCLDAAPGAPGFYRLTAATGSGKTRSALAFALEHAVQNKMERVVVAIPFTSIVEQTADTYCAILTEYGLPGEAMLEHHSAIELDRGRAADLVAENWDAPLVVTTSVQLMDSLFSNRRTRVRKLNRLAKSVIVIDEPQAMPAELLVPYTDALRELVETYGASVVLSTATQPELGSPMVNPERQGLELSEIIPAGDAREHFRRLERVRYFHHRKTRTLPEVSALVRRKATKVASRMQHEAGDRCGTGGESSEPRALIVLNSRRDALQVFEALAADTRDTKAQNTQDSVVFHLSTTMCGAHRRAVIPEVRRRLKKREPCYLVSTQVVEAGVDLDFPVGFRALGQFDSIAQVAGRVNREDLMPFFGELHVFSLYGERKPTSNSYRIGASKAGRALRGGVDLNNPAAFLAYFRDLYGELGIGGLDGRELQEKRRNRRFKEVAEASAAILDDGVSVLIPEAAVSRALEETARGAPEDNTRPAFSYPDAAREAILGCSPGAVLHDARAVQPIVVQLRQHEADALESSGAIRRASGGIYDLRDETLYDARKGLSTHVKTAR